MKEAEQRSQTAKVILVLLVAALAVVLLVVPGPFRPGGGASSTRAKGGPLAGGGASDTVSLPQTPGGDVTFGHVVLSNSGSAIARLEGVSFEPPLHDNLKLLGVQVATDPDREFATVGAVRGYPPEEPIGRLVPLKGAEVPPKGTPEGERGAALIMGFRLQSVDLAGFRQVKVRYRVGSRLYETTLNQGFIVCSSVAYPDGCPDRKDVFPAS